MTELYLIAHKVRGEPAFDVAINIGSEVDGDMWIIPTSGHRAYPYWYSELVTADMETGPMPEDLPDHYPINKPSSAPRPTIGAAELDDILADIDELKSISEQRGDEQ